MSNDSQTLQNLRLALLTIAGSLVCVLVPVEFVVAIGLPLLIWREVVRSRRFGFWPGAGVRFGVMAAVFTIAIFLPTKQLDRRIGPFSQASATLGELKACRAITVLAPEFSPQAIVPLPSTNPTRREVLAALKGQPEFDVRLKRCGTGASLLLGSSAAVFVDPALRLSSIPDRAETP